MNLFEIVKNNVNVPDAAEKYGIRANHHGMTKCPFHDDRHPSLKLNDHYFYCFGCGATGDVIDLVARLYHLKPYEASRKLATDFRIDPDRPPAEPVLTRPKHPMIRAFREDERYCLRVLCDYLRLLEKWKEQYAPQKMEEEPDDRFVEACHMHDYVEYLADTLTVGDLELRMTVVKNLMEDDKIGGLEEKVRRDSRKEKERMDDVEKERITG